MFNIFIWYVTKSQTLYIYIYANSCIYMITSVNNSVKHSFYFIITYLYNIQMLCQDTYTMRFNPLWFTLRIGANIRGVYYKLLLYSGLMWAHLSEFTATWLNNKHADAFTVRRMSGSSRGLVVPTSRRDVISGRRSRRRHMCCVHVMFSRSYWYNWTGYRRFSDTVSIGLVSLYTDTQLTKHSAEVTLVPWCVRR